MNAERIGVLKGWLRENRAEYNHEIVADLLSLLDEKAAQIKAGAELSGRDLAKKAIENGGYLPPPPGLSDERALKILYEESRADEYNRDFMAADQALAHIRSRLAEGTPKAELLHGDVMCEICGAIGHLLPAPPRDTTQFIHPDGEIDWVKPAPPEPSEEEREDEWALEILRRWIAERAVNHNNGRTVPTDGAVYEYLKGMMGKYRALIASPAPKVSVTKKDVIYYRWAGLESMIDWLREAGVEVVEKP